MDAEIHQKHQAAEIVQGWLRGFADACRSGEVSAFQALFEPDGHWRDVLAFTWKLQTVSSSTSIALALNRVAVETSAGNFHLLAGRSQPRRVRRAGTDCIEAVFGFETGKGPAEGVVRLIEAGTAGGARAWTLSTNLQELRQRPEFPPRSSSDAEYYSRDFGADNWLDQRARDRSYVDRDPTVLVVGGGQAGLSVAARLKQLGVDTLIVDRHDRIGDNWRQRYHSLTLHNEVHVNHLPYMPFPATWPVFIPKDKLANWFESYVDSQDLNYWPGTALVSGEWDAAAARWRLVLRRDRDGERILRPRHVIFATGVSAIPIRPDISGLDAFAGTVMHSGDFTDGRAWTGKKAIVLGTGNSGHDVAQDLCVSGAETVMIQRSPTYVVSISEAQKVYSIYTEGLPFEDCDLIATSMPYPVLRQSYQLSTAEMREVDRELHGGLRRRGFQLAFGEDDTGFQMMYLRRGGGYYFNVGCSDMIIDGRIRLVQFDELNGFEKQGLRMKDGSLLAADLVVAATGYKNQQETVRAYLGDAIAERIGPVWGFDEQGELRNMWRRTAQPGLWFTAGSLAQCRIYSRYLALQIKAIELGLLPLQG